MPQRMKDRLREASINFEYDRDVYLKLRLNTDCTSDALFASKYLCRLSCGGGKSSKKACTSVHNLYYFFIDLDGIIFC
jgi:hypothetical protein